MTRDYYAPPVIPGSSVCLADYDPRTDAGLSRREASRISVALRDELQELQELLYAAGTHSVLIILQGMDTSGKDGATRNLLTPVSPIGCRVHAFKVPTEEELAHDFLWRVHAHVPPRGMIAIFNRSHYEDVLVVRVKNLTSENVWRARYRQINDFERLLYENDTIVFKFFLHISPEEQEERLRAREEEVIKAWKLSPGDWHDRALWQSYQQAYEEALQQCSSAEAPWYIVPADRKWFRNLAILDTVVTKLRPYRKGWMKQMQALHDERLPQVHAARGATGEAATPPEDTRDERETDE